MVKHNNIIPNVHLRKHWQGRVHTHHDQPALKKKRYERRVAKATRMFPRPIQKLRPIVSSMTRRYAGKVRYGRGFTLQELKAVKLSARFARTVGISVDHRRTNTSEEQLQLNVDRLNTYKSKLILWPRVADKPKKGQIDDSTAQQLASAGASNQVSGKVLPREKAEQKDEFAAITKADKERKVFRTLRVLRTNKHYHGRRVKRAEAEAEKEK